jgi:hypothetical protein
VTNLEVDLLFFDTSLQFSVLIGGWDTVAEDLKTFSHMAVAAQVGCSWCLDINYFQAQNHNLDMAKASQVPRWREADVFTSLERDVLEYSEAMTNTADRHRRDVRAPARPARPGRDGGADQLHRVREHGDAGQRGAGDRVTGVLGRLRGPAGHPR